jgi:hypothetical protein
MGGRTGAGAVGQARRGRPDDLGVRLARGAASLTLRRGLLVPGRLDAAAEDQRVQVPGCIRGKLQNCGQLRKIRQAANYAASGI